MSEMVSCPRWCRPRDGVVSKMVPCLRWFRVRDGVVPEMVSCLTYVIFVFAPDVIMRAAIRPEAGMVLFVSRDLHI